MYHISSHTPTATTTTNDNKKKKTITRMYVMLVMLAVCGFILVVSLAVWRGWVFRMPINTSVTSMAIVTAVLLLLTMPPATTAIDAEATAIMKRIGLECRSYCGTDNVCFSACRCERLIDGFHCDSVASPRWPRLCVSLALECGGT